MSLYVIINYNDLSKDYSTIYNYVEKVESIHYKYNYRSFIIRDLFGSKIFNKKFVNDIEEFIIEADCFIIKENIKNISTLTFISPLYKNYLSLRYSCNVKGSIDEYLVEKYHSIFLIKKEMNKLNLFLKKENNYKVDKLSFDIKEILNICKNKFSKYPIKNPDKFCINIYSLIGNNYI